MSDSVYLHPLSDGSALITVVAGERVLDLHNQSTIAAVAAFPASGRLDVCIDYNEDWERLGQGDDERLTLRFTGVRDLVLSQAPDFDVASGLDFESYDCRRDADGIIIVLVKAGDHELSLRAEKCVLVISPPAVADGTV